MISSTPGPQPRRSPHPRHGLHDLRYIVKCIRRSFQHASDSPNNPQLSSEAFGQRMAISTADPFRSSSVAKTLTRAANLAYSWLDAFSIGQDSLGPPVQSIHWQKKSSLAPIPIWEVDLERGSLPPNGLLGTLSSFFKPSSSSLFSASFRLRTFHWFCGLLMKESSCTTDALVYAPSDICPTTSSHKVISSNDTTSGKVSNVSLQREKVDKSVLDLNSPCQVLNSPRHPDESDPSNSSSSVFARQDKQYSSIHGPRTNFEEGHDILQTVAVKGQCQTARNCVSRVKGHVCLEDKPTAFYMTKEREIISTSRQPGGSYSEPEDNAGYMKRVENGHSRAPADGETSKKSPKKQKRSSHYDHGTKGTTKATKKRKRDSTGREEDDDFDDSGRGGGRPNTGKRRKDEEEDSGKSKFACPFYKNDPQAFRGSRTCVGPGWSSVHRVKEHIFRRHMLSDSQCHSCLEDCGTQAALDEHLEIPCPQKPPLRSHAINKKQEKQLRSRKMYRKSLCEEEKWRAIYKIIFPHEDNIPSPYYEPELPEFPDEYRRLLIDRLPEMVTKQLTAPESGLMKHITATSQPGRKLNEGLSLTGPTGVSSYSQLVEQINRAVEAAVRKTLSQVDDPSSKGLQIPVLNVESPETESKASIEKEGELQPIPLQDNLLKPPSTADLKYETGIITSSPLSSTFTPSPVLQFGVPTEPALAQSNPYDLDWSSLVGDNSADNILQHTTGGNPFPVIGTGPGIWDDHTFMTDAMYAPLGPELNRNFHEPASLQTVELLPRVQSPENYSLEPWGFPQAASREHVDSGYGSIAGPADSNLFDGASYSNGYENLDIHYMGRE